jgi:hypothetical protein
VTISTRRSLVLQADKTGFSSSAICALIAFRCSGRFIVRTLMRIHLRDFDRRPTSAAHFRPCAWCRSAVRRCHRATCATNGSPASAGMKWPSCRVCLPDAIVLFAASTALADRSCFCLSSALTRSTSGTSSQRWVRKAEQPCRLTPRPSACCPRRRSAPPVRAAPHRCAEVSLSFANCRCTVPVHAGACYQFDRCVRLGAAPTLRASFRSASGHAHHGLQDAQPLSLRAGDAERTAVRRVAVSAPAPSAGGRILMPDSRMPATGDRR